jgi:Ras-related protein Rab-5C
VIEDVTEPEPTTPSENEDEDDDDESIKATTPATPANDSDDPRQVAFADAEAYAKESSLLFFEASAKVCLCLAVRIRR